MLTLGGAAAILRQMTGRANHANYVHCVPDPVTCDDEQNRAYDVKNIEEGPPLMLQITPAERAALLLLANGISTNELAGRFGVSERDMEAHLTTLFARMGAASRTEAIAAAFRRGLLNGSPSLDHLRCSS